MDKLIEHKTELDGAGWMGRPRLTCYTCNGATLVKQPYMSGRLWLEKASEFAKDHPSKITADYLHHVQEMMSDE